MCGLVGIFDRHGTRDIDQAILMRMNTSLRHRGPDGEGSFVAPGIGLGHRRLSIIDLARGDQPMFNEDESVAVVYNGEIYNFPELKVELEELGYRFQSHCDTEVIVHGWEAWGPACVKKFRGMFAFALWDSNKNTLFLARDRLGKKPLYYADMPNGLFIFGSELKALLEHPATERRIDPQAVEDYFAYGYIPDPKSIYKSIRKLPPAHTLTLRRGSEPKFEEYWDLPVGNIALRDTNQASAELTAHLREATRMRLISDVPLGAFLSGGVDSSGVVAMMAGVNPDTINTFSISFGDGAYDESSYAQAVADRYNTNHVSRELDPDEFSVLDQLGRVYDEPFGDSSAMPTYRVCAVASEYVKVCLSGDGGDELFAGYRRYLWHDREAKVRRMLPNGLRRSLFGTLGNIYPKLDWAPRPLRAQTTFRELAMSDEEAFFNSVSVTNDIQRAKLFCSEFKNELQGYHANQVLFEHMRAADTDRPLLKAQYTDIKTWLAGGILTKVDRASMANSLEIRAPLLDHKIAEWSTGLHPNLKLKGAEGKYILKRALEPLVPNRNLYRPKQGFSMPLCDWFRGPLKQRVRDGLSSSEMSDANIFDTSALDVLMSQHEKGTRDNSPVLWLLLMFSTFLKNQASA